MINNCTQQSNTHSSIADILYYSFQEHASRNAVLCIGFSKHIMGSNETEAHELLFRQQIFDYGNHAECGSPVSAMLAYIYIAVTIINNDCIMCNW